MSSQHHQYHLNNGNSIVSLWVDVQQEGLQEDKKLRHYSHISTI